MSDLYWAMGVMGVISLGVLIGTAWGTRNGSRNLLLIGMLATAAALVVYLRVWQDRLFWAEWMPVSNVMILSNLTPLLGAVLGGLAWSAMKAPWWWRTVMVSALMFLSAWQAWWIVWSERPETHNVVRGGVWLQTTQATCTPAAAATFLGAHGILTTESRMVDHCLTTPQGTSALAAYRGLLQATEGTEWRVEVLDSASIEDLRNFTTSPVLINVGLAASDVDKVDPRYITHWGWSPGARHTVVLVNFYGQSVGVADPSAGLEQWSLDALRTLWRGEAYRLVRRE